MRDGLKIAVTGSMSTEKTTLARALSEAFDLPLVSEEMRAHLTSSGSRLSSLSAAEAAKVLREFWRKRLLTERDHAASGFVADSCGADFVAYALQHGCADECVDLIDEAYWRDVGYDAVFVLPWSALPYERDGVRVERLGDERRYQLIIESLLSQNGRVQRVPAALQTVDERLRFCGARMGTIIQIIDH